MAAEEFDPSPANIEKHLTRSKLDNGIHLSLLPKQSRGGLVNAILELRFGDAQSLLGKNAAASMTASLLMRGTKNKTRQQIQEELDRLNAQIRMGGGAIGTASASIQTTAGNLIPALKLAAEILREPAFPESDFDQIRKQQIEGIRRGATDPATLAREELQKHLNTYPASDVRHYQTMEERLADLEKVTLDDVKKFHQQFYGASHGNSCRSRRSSTRRPSVLRPPSCSVNGPLPTHYARISSEFSKVTSVNRKVETPDKQNAQFEAGLRFSMTDKDPDYPAMVLANYMLGGEITSRLPDRIRNREGLSYGVNSIFSAPAEGDIAGPHHGGHRQPRQHAKGRSQLPRRNRAHPA